MNLPQIQKKPANPDACLSEAITLQERLHLIGLLDQGLEPALADGLSGLFQDLSEQIDKTVQSSNLQCLNPQNSSNGFHRIEINSESGETLGWMNMLYFNKTIPCYYLIYVEVAPFFRKKGLGSRIIDRFKQFLIEKSALGILDNIIPKEDPTFSLYQRSGWQPLDDYIAKPLPNNHYERYLIYVPPGLRKRDFKNALPKMFYHLSRKREIMDMRDNESMVQQTLQEFRGLYQVLQARSQAQTDHGKIDIESRFFYTRFVIKLIAFRRLIGDLIGYTGGESIEQIILAPEIAAWPIQSYVPAEWIRAVPSISGDFELLAQLPEALLRKPAVFIESLPNYQRLSLKSWLEKKGTDRSPVFTIGDLMDLGFDPTRLKEITLKGRTYVFERVQRKQWTDIQKKQRLLDRLKTLIASQTIQGTRMKINPPLLWISDQGHTYILREKIAAIHWEEALEQVQTQAALKPLNRLIGLDKRITQTIQSAMSCLSAALTLEEQKEWRHLSWFVSWNQGSNQPALVLDDSEPYFETVFLA